MNTSFYNSWQTQIVIPILKTNPRSEKRKERETEDRSWVRIDMGRLGETIYKEKGVKEGGGVMV